MARRAILAAAALASALSGFVVSPPASAGDDYCGSGLPAAGAMAGYVGAGDDADWWSHPVLPGKYLVTLVSGPADADLTVGDEGCGTLCDSATPIGPDVCEAKTDGWDLTIGVWSGSEYPSAYSIVVTPIGPPRTACNDDEDNDGDSLKDYPADAGCTGLWDNTEDTTQCSATPAGEVCSEVVVGGVRREYIVDQLDTDTYTIAGSVDWYRFPALGNVEVLCVVLIVRPGVWSDPCKKAGGKFHDNVHTLHNYPTNVVPDGNHSRRPLIRTCDATVTITVNGLGRPFDAITECRTPNAEE